MRDPSTFQLDLPPDQRPPLASLAEKIHTPAWSAAWRCTHARPTGPENDIRVIVIHATAGSSTEGAVSVMQEGRASFHWLVPDEDEAAHGRFVWATAPEARAAWHVRKSCSHPDICDGATGLNGLSLGIEIVNAQPAEHVAQDRFSAWQVAASAAIVRHAWAKYPNLAHVVSHARLDPQRRTDPGPHFPWERFVDLILADAR